MDRALPDLNAGRATAVAIAPDESFIAMGLAGGDIQVQHLDEDRPHRLIGPAGNVTSLWIDPHGFWIAVGTDRGQLWWLPVPHGRPLDDLTGDEFGALLRDQTNVRVVVDPTTPEGYRQSTTAFRGWDTVPSWQQWYSDEYMKDPPWKPMLDPETMETVAHRRGPTGCSASTPRRQG